MKVFIVTKVFANQDISEIVGVWSDLDKANEFISKDPNRYNVEIHEVIE